MNFLTTELLLIISLLNAAYGLRCWMCIGSLDSDCYRGEENAMVIQECAATFRNATTPKLPNGGNANQFNDEKDDVIVNTCVTFIQRQYGTSFIERGCGYIYQDVDICEYLSNVTDVVACSSCNEDLCNNAPQLKTVQIILV